MQLKYLRSVLSPEECNLEIIKVAWSSNNLKLALATDENTILIFDDLGVRRDRFTLKPVDIKFGKKSFTVTGLAFSPDSVKIAVGQSDGVIYVYKIGNAWGEKKSICNKFIQNDAVSCLHWLSEGPIIYGLANGRVRSSNIKANKSKTLYKTESTVVSLAPNNRGTGFLSGHMDGTIVRFYVKFDRKPEKQGVIINMKSPPFALAWANDFVMAAGADPVVMIYKNTGELHKVYDYTDDETGEMIYVACACPSGHCVVFGCVDGLRCYSWKPRKKDWEEDAIKRIEGLSDITCLAWKPDGSRLAVGTASGVCDVYESALRRMVFKKKIEVSYVGPSQIVIKSCIPGASGFVFSSNTGNEIEEVRIMGDNDQYVVARTTETLILLNLEEKVLSEIQWPPSSTEERFIFRYPSVCMIYRPTELSLVEYGVNEILTTVNTTMVTPSLISVRINERRPNKEVENKRFAYMMDVFTVCIVDLVNCTTVALHQHHTRIDWLDLNETGGKLLFQDRRKVVFLLDADYNSCVPLVNQCTFVQWVEGSNAVIAQTRNTVYVWYNINDPDEMICYNVTGMVTDVIRDHNKLIVVTEEADQQLVFDLNLFRLDFETAIGDQNIDEAYAILLQSEDDPDIGYMWNILAKMAMRSMNFHIAKDCYGRLGDMPHIHFVNKLLALAETTDNPDDVTQLKEHPLIRIQLAIFDHNIQAALDVYTKGYQLKEALDLCTHYRLWDTAYNLASRFGATNLEEFREKYISHLLTNKQFCQAAEIREREGQFVPAFFYYLKAGNPAMAAMAMMKSDDLMDDAYLINKMLNTLKRNHYYRAAGELYERLDEMDAAFKMYYVGSEFHKAIELARKLTPAEVVFLENKWGDHLMTHQQPEAAINHYIEAGCIHKAVKAAMAAQQWKKAADIVKSIDDPESIVTTIQTLAEYFISVKDYDSAEVLYAKAGLWEEALDMYQLAGEWDRAQKMAIKYLDNEQIADLYSTRANRLAEEDKLEEAEKLFVTVGDADSAITMYKKRRLFHDMIRLVREYHPDLLRTTHSRLAQELENEGRYAEAKYHYLQIDDFNSVIKMYQSVGRWEDAYEVAKKYTAPQVVDQVIYRWAKELHHTSAVRLLRKLNAVETSIELACDNYQFDFALYVANSALESKVPDVHYKYAVALEDDGKLEEAEEHFIKANKPKEAVLMYIHCNDWENAIRVTEEYDPDSLCDTLKSHAKVAFEKQQYNLFEKLLLRADEAELIVETYKGSGMWEDALKICNDYLSPSHLEALQQEYDKLFASTVNKEAVERIFMKAQAFEKRNQYEEAIGCYLQVDENITEEESILLKAWKTAAELCSRYMDENRCKEVAKILGPKLRKVNQTKLAVQIYLAGSMVREAIDVYISVGDWKKAKKLADEFDGSYVPYVEKIYSESIMYGGIEEMIKHKEAEKEIKAKLDKLAQQNEFKKCLDLAEEHQVDLDQYVAKYALHLIKAGTPHLALNLLLKYDAPASEPIIFIYKRLVNAMMYTVLGGYNEWATLRSLLFRLVENLNNPSVDVRTISVFEYERLLLIIHYFAAREAYRVEPSLQFMVAKVSTAMLRYVDVIPPDRAFFEAGADCRACGMDSEAFLYLNCYLDIHEAIKEQSWEYFDKSHLKHTDVPLEIALPQKTFIEDSLYEETKEWVLAQSMDEKTVSIEDLLDDRQLLPHSLSPRDNDSDEDDDDDMVVKNPTFKRDPCSPCLLSGFPVLQRHGEKPIHFRRRGVLISRYNWQQVLAAGKDNTACLVNDVLDFITRWCGSPVELNVP